MFPDICLAKADPPNLNFVFPSSALRLSWSTTDDVEGVADLELGGVPRAKAKADTPV